VGVGGSKIIHKSLSGQILETGLMSERAGSYSMPEAEEFSDVATPLPPAVSL